MGKDGENVATISSTLTLVDKMTSKLNTIRDAVEEVQNSLNSIGDEQSSLDKFSWDTFLSNAEAAGKQMQRIGKSMSLAVTTPLVLLGKKMYGNATDYESAFAGVKKTTDATQEEYDRLYSDLLEISERSPTGFVEGAGIMEMAGQLGVGKVNEFGEDISAQYQVATEDLTKFTEAYIGLQESTNIQGESGAADLARFLNVTEKTTANVDRVGGVIVGLGNNFATTEAEILSMATRMGATADLAGFSAPEILAFSAALSAVGINAEAGGSAAGKLMKKMQLAAEVGGTAQARLDALGKEALHFDSGLDFSNWLSIQKKEDLAELAWKLGTTTDAVQDLADSWLSLDQFSEVMGVDQAGFLQSWNEGAATSMLRFFQGLGNLDPESGNSVLAQLAEMDLTEIRLSNLVAAMSGNSALFEAALEEAYRQYNLDPATNAMAEEVAKRYATQESQNEMLGNKLDNTMADFGQNLVDALNPALEVVNQILEKFNSLSEIDQTHIIELLGALAITGPTLTAVGKTVELVSKLAQGLEKIHNLGGVETAVNGAAGASGAGNVAGAAAGGSALAGVAGAGAIAAGFVWAANERLNNENIRGSVNAINQATQGNVELQQAFIDYVQTNQEMQAAIDSGDFSNTAVFESADQANAAFQALDGWKEVYDAYSAWRQENSLGNMDFQMPEGLLEIFSQSMQNSGADVTAGLANGITGSEGTATNAATEMAQATIDAANGALGVNSPSVLMIQSGLNTVQGLALGITTGSGVVVAAMVMVSNQTLAAARGILNQAAGSSIGYNVAAGIASGIRSGSGMAAAAARALANSVISTLRASLQVHSPSRVTYAIGDNTGIGFVNGILDNRNDAEKAMGRVVGSAQRAWNTATWSDIALFAGLENDQLLSDAKDAVQISDADIRKIRDLAEREVINHFTTAKVEVEMTNNNSINSNMDLDGIVDYLGDKVTERLEAVAEGVYS